MKKIIVISLTFLFIGITSKSWAWGKTGHRVVANVACRHLTDKAKKNINAILGGHSMAEVANWMDDIKSDTNPDLDTLRDYHWVTIPDGMTYAQSNKNSKGDVIKGLHIVIAKLKKGGLSPMLEREYLKMLIHFIGDLHEPLHVGRGDDRGGNSIKLEWFGHHTNLHAIWDSEMINSKLLSYTELSDMVDCCASPNQIKMWQSGTIEDWAEECVQLRPQIYHYDTSKRYWEYHYAYNNWNTVKSQLEKGGVRLAGILNNIFG
ncbi:MAG TPA: S1/P1 nuclease [Ignavibacteriaceae bacterium]